MFLKNIILWQRPNCLRASGGRRRLRTQTASTQSLEVRALLASVMDSGDTLRIDLDANEQLTVVAAGNHYAFNSDSGSFNDAGVGDATDFTGFGSATLLFNDLSAYTAVSITDAASGAAVHFGDSGLNAYQHDFHVSLMQTVAENGAVSFSGTSHFAGFDLTVQTAGQIHLRDGSLLRTVDGDITMTAANTGVATGANRGISLFNAAIETSGRGKISLNGTGTNAEPVNDFRIGVLMQNGSQISSTATTADAGTITLVGTGGNGNSFNYGVQLESGSHISSVSGDISITGSGGDGVGLANHGVLLVGSSSVRSTGIGPDAANITIQGTGGVGTNWNSGVTALSGVSVHTVDGDISITGNGGAASGVSNRGITMEEFGVIESTGTGEHAGTITINASGGSGTGDAGGAVIRGATSEVRSVDGTIHISADGGLLSSGDANGGLWLAASVRTTGTADIVLDGSATTERNQTSHHGGLSIAGVGTVVETMSGNITVTGQGGFSDGDSNHGVRVHAEATVATTSGVIFISGVGGSGDESRDIWLLGSDTSGAQILSRGVGEITLTAVPDDGSRGRFEAGPNTLIGGSEATGDISFFMQGIALAPSVVIRSTGELFLTPMPVGGFTLGRESDNVFQFSLTDSEISTIHSGFSHITIGSPEIHEYYANVHLESARFESPITIFAGHLFTGTGTALIAPNITLEGVLESELYDQVFFEGDLTLAENSKLSVIVAGEFDGFFYGEPYTQVSVEGRVDLAPDVELQTSWWPTWQPVPGETLTIVKRNGGTGEFKDLPEGAVLPHLFNATISYVGGDGDDIVLQLPQDIAEIHALNLGESAGNHFTVYGIDERDGQGQTTGTAGDINGDGFADVLVAAPHADAINNGRLRAGEVYVVLGSANLPANIDPVPGESWGITILGAEQSDRAGYSLDSRDLNDDGYSDILLGTERGSTHVIWGNVSLPDTIDLAAPNCSCVTTFTGLPGWGFNVAVLGDINGNARPDVAIGEFGGGRVFLILDVGSLYGEIDLSQPHPNVVRVVGPSTSHVGPFVSAIGDVSGDGIDDLVFDLSENISIIDDRFASQTHVLFGNTEFPAVIDLVNGTLDGTVISGIESDLHRAYRSTGGGDVNGDGFNDLLVEVKRDVTQGRLTYQTTDTFLIFGGFDSTEEIDLQSLANHGIRITGTNLRFIQDINGDGFDEIAGQWETSVAILPGRNVFGSDISFAKAGEDVRFIIFSQIDGSYGSDIQAAGDVDGDGIGDLVVGSFNTNSENGQRSHAGEAYIIPGPSILPPAYPAITAPFGTSDSIRPTLSWHASEGAESYEVWLELIGGSSNPVTNPTLTDTSYKVPTDLVIGRYRTWVRANKSDGSTSRWASREFEISRSTVVRELPFNGQDVRPMIEWDAVTGATGYQIYVSNITQQVPAIINEVVTGTSYVPNFDFQFGTHRIWVRPIGAGNFAAEWSQPRDYSLGPILQAPVGLSTLNDRPTFTWTASPNVTTYDLYVQHKGSVVLRETVVVDSSQFSTGSFQPDAPLPDGDYRWWVRAIAPNGRAGSWGTGTEFNIGGATSLVLGPAGTTYDAMPTVIWQEVEEASAYEIYLYRDDANELIHRETGLVSTSFDSAPLQPGDYRVWIRSYQQDGSPASWSRAHSFSIQAEVPGLIPAAVGPLGPTLNHEPTFAWTIGEAAASYNLYLTNGETAVHQTGITNQQWTPTTPLSIGPWQWQIQAVNGDGQAGPWTLPVSTDTSGRAVLLAPVGTTNQTQPAVMWTPVTDAVKYVLQIDNLTTGQSAMIREDNLIATSFIPSTPFSPGAYRAWVRAVGAGPVLAPWSLALDFVIN